MFMWSRDGGYKPAGLTRSPAASLLCGLFAEAARPVQSPAGSLDKKKRKKLKAGKLILIKS